MSLSLVALDYSRPLLSLFKQAKNTGYVHSVFRQVINVAFDDTIVSINSTRLQRTPIAVRVAPISIYMDEFFRIVKKDMKVQMNAECLTLTIPACECTVYLPKIDPWEPRPAIEHHQWHHTFVVQHTNALIDFLIDKNRDEGLGNVALPLLKPTQQNRRDQLHRMALPLLRLLMLASWWHDRAGIEQAVRGLAGLGPGLTPSGDDVLAGFAAVMFLLSELLGADGVSRSYIAEMIANIACPRTTLLSATFLRCAARGEVSESLGQLLIGLALPLEESENVLNAAEPVLDFGASSGSDTLLGVLAGLRTLEGEASYGFTSCTKA